MKPISFNWQNGGGYGNANEGLAVSEDHTGPLSRSQTLAVAQPVPYDLCQVTAPVNRQNRAPGDPCHTLAQDNASRAAIVAPQPSASVTDMRGLGDGSVSPTLRAKETANDFTPIVQTQMQVRRPTPVECERLQGFPDNYTAIQWRNKPASECPDGPRYKALGNSMAVPVMRWIGQQINKAK